MKRVLLLIVVFFSVVYLLDSCHSSCNCTKDMGCLVLMVKKKGPLSANTILSRKIICPLIDYHRSYADLQDSINVFEKLYNTDSTYVELKDSIYKSYDEIWTKHNLNRYTNSGYFCGCPI